MLVPKGKPLLRQERVVPKGKPDSGTAATGDLSGSRTDVSDLSEDSKNLIPIVKKAPTPPLKSLVPVVPVRPRWDGDGKNLGNLICSHCSRYSCLWSCVFSSSKEVKGTSPAVKIDAFRLKI